MNHKVRFLARWLIRLVVWGTFTITMSIALADGHQPAVLAQILIGVILVSWLILRTTPPNNVFIPPGEVQAPRWHSALAAAFVAGALIMFLFGSRYVVRTAKQGSVNMVITVNRWTGEVERRFVP